MAAVRIQFRRGPENDWNQYDPILADGELGYESTNKIIKFGDGIRQWSSLPVAAQGDIHAVRVTAGSGLRYTSATTGFGSASAGESGVVGLEIDPTRVVVTSTFDSAGDTLIGTGNDTYTVLHVGSNGQTIIADSSQGVGVRWGTPTDPIISNNYINNNMIAANAVTEAKIRGSATVDADRSITTDKIRDLAITESKISNSSVTVDKIRGDSNDANDALRSVTSDKIRNSAITAAKLATNAVTTDKILNGQIIPSKLNNAVYYRVTDLGTSSTARVFIQAVGNPPTTGNPGDLWFAFE